MPGMCKPFALLLLLLLCLAGSLLSAEIAAMPRGGGEPVAAATPAHCAEQAQVLPVEAGHADCHDDLLCDCPCMQAGAILPPLPVQMMPETRKVFLALPAGEAYTPPPLLLPTRPPIA